MLKVRIKSIMQSVIKLNVVVVNVAAPSNGCKFISVGSTST
jgi:hypothetical protein